MKNNFIAIIFMVFGVSYFMVSPVFAYTCTSFSKEVSRSSSKKDIIALQNFLIEAGYLSGDSSGTFGVLGTTTVFAIKLFQKDNNLSQVGSLGPKTRAKIKEFSCNSNKVSSGMPHVASTTLVRDGSGKLLMPKESEYTAIINANSFPKTISSYTLNRINKKNEPKCSATVCALISEVEYTSSINSVIVEFTQLLKTDPAFEAQKNKQWDASAHLYSKGVIDGSGSNTVNVLDWRNSKQFFIRANYTPVPNPTAAEVEKQAAEFRRTGVQPLLANEKKRGWGNITIENEVVKYFLSTFKSMDGIN